MKNVVLNIIIVCLTLLSFLVYGQDTDNYSFEGKSHNSQVFVIVNQLKSSINKRNLRKGDPNCVLQASRIECFNFSNSDEFNCEKAALLKLLSKNRDVLIFVHGDGKSFDKAISRAVAIQKLYDVQVVVFT